MKSAGSVLVASLPEGGSIRQPLDAVDVCTALSRLAPHLTDATWQISREERR